MALIETLWQLVLTFIGLVILAIPLYITVGLLGGKRSLLSVIVVNLLTGFLFVALQAKYPFWGVLLGFFLAIWLFHEIFRLKWWKAIVAFFLQFLILVLFWFLVGAVLAAAGIATGLIIGAGIFG